MEIDSDSDASAADENGTGSWMRETVAPSKVSIEIEQLDSFAFDLQRHEFQHIFKQIALKSRQAVEHIISNPLKASEVLCLFLTEELLATFSSIAHEGLENSTENSEKISIQEMQTYIDVILQCGVNDAYLSDILSSQIQNW